MKNFLVAEGGQYPSGPGGKFILLFFYFQKPIYKIQLNFLCQEMELNKN
jgi:hypothetical protein